MDKIGSRGPIPLRSEERKGHAHQAGGHAAGITKGVARRVTKPKPNPEWCDFAKYVFDAFGKSGTADWAQNTDWAAAWLLAENVNDYLRTSRRSAMAMSEIRQMMGDLMYTESSRRRVGIELEENIKPAEDKGKQGVNSARERLQKKVN